MIFLSPGGCLDPCCVIVLVHKRILLLRFQEIRKRWKGGRAQDTWHWQPVNCFANNRHICGCLILCSHHLSEPRASCHYAVSDQRQPIAPYNKPLISILIVWNSHGCITALIYLIHSIIDHNKDLQADLWNILLYHKYIRLFT